MCFRYSGLFRGNTLLKTKAFTSAFNYPHSLRNKAMLRMKISREFKMFLLTICCLFHLSLNLCRSCWQVANLTDLGLTFFLLPPLQWSNIPDFLAQSQLHTFTPLSLGAHSHLWATDTLIEIIRENQYLCALCLRDQPTQGKAKWKTSWKRVTGKLRLWS